MHRDGGKLIPMGIGILLVRVCLRPGCNEVIDEPRKEGLLAGGFCGIEIDAPVGGIGKGSEAFVDRVLRASIGASKARIAEATRIAEAIGVVFLWDRQWAERGDTAFHEKDF